MVRKTALLKVTNPAVLSSIAMNDNDSEVRKLAVQRMQHKK
jgi:hypothetical protein